MDVAGGIVVCITAIVNYRHVAQSAAAVRQPSAAIRGAHRGNIGDASRNAKVAVEIIAADLLVQIEELIDADRSALQRGQPVLNAREMILVRE